jgi:hypothetical protein
MHARTKVILVTLHAIGITTFAGAANAQTDYTEQRTEAGTAVVFKEDLTTGSTLDTSGGTIVVQRSAFRMGLVRPRLNFVSEMLKSVESL